MKHSPTPTIGLDLDGVLADTDAMLRTYVHTVFGKKVSREDITSLYYEECLKFSDDEMLHFWKEFHKDSGWEKINRIDEAHTALHTLKNIYRLVVVTSRPASLHDVTKKWLEHHGMPFDDLVVTCTETKSAVIKNRGWHLSYFIEDRHDFAVDIAALGIPVFLLDYPWNRSFHAREPIMRVRNWAEITKRILHAHHARGSHV